MGTTEYPVRILDPDDQSLDLPQKWATRYFHCHQIVQANSQPSASSPEADNRCLCTFQSPGGLMRHLIQHHIDDGVFYCFYCHLGRLFGSKDGKNSTKDQSEGIFEGPNGHDDLLRHLIKDHTSLKYLCGLCPYRGATVAHVALHAIAVHTDEYVASVDPILCMNAHIQDADNLDKDREYGFPVILCQLPYHKTSIPGKELIQKKQVNPLTNVPATNQFQCRFCSHYGPDKMDTLCHVVHRHPDLPVSMYSLTPELRANTAGKSEVQFLPAPRTPAQPKQMNSSAKSSFSESKVMAEQPKVAAGNYSLDRMHVSTSSSALVDNVNMGSWEDEEDMSTDDTGPVPVPELDPTPPRAYGIRSATPKRRPQSSGRGLGSTTPGRAKTPARGTTTNFTRTTTPRSEKRKSGAGDGDDTENDWASRSPKRPRGVIAEQFRQAFDPMALGAPTNRLDKLANHCTLCKVDISSIAKNVRIHLKDKHGDKSFVCSYPACKYVGSKGEIEAHHQSQHRGSSHSEEGLFRKIVIPKQEANELSKPKLPPRRVEVIDAIPTFTKARSGSKSAPPKKQKSALEKTKEGYRGPGNKTIELVRKGLIGGKSTESANVSASKATTSEKVKSPKKTSSTSISLLNKTANNKLKTSVTRVAAPVSQARPTPSHQDDDGEDDEDDIGGGGEPEQNMDALVCLFCDKFKPTTQGANQRKQWTKHLTDHLDVRSFCTLCSGTFQWSMRNELEEHFKLRHPDAPLPPFDKDTQERRTRRMTWANLFFSNLSNGFKPESSVMTTATDQEGQGSGMKCFICEKMEVAATKSLAALNQKFGSIVFRVPPFRDPDEFRDHVYEHSSWASGMCNWCIQPNEEEAAMFGDVPASRKFVVRSTFKFADHLHRYHKNRFPPSLAIYPAVESLLTKPEMSDMISDAFTKYEHHDIINDKIENEINHQINRWMAATGQKMATSGRRRASSTTDQSLLETDPAGGVKLIIKQEVIDPKERAPAEAMDAPPPPPSRVVAVTPPRANSGASRPCASSSSQASSGSETNKPKSSTGKPRNTNTFFVEPRRPPPSDVNMEPEEELIVSQDDDMMDEDEIESMVLEPAELDESIERVFGTYERTGTSSVLSSSQGSSSSLCALVIDECSTAAAGGTLNSTSSESTLTRIENMIPKGRKGCVYCWDPPFIADSPDEIKRHCKAQHPNMRVLIAFGKKKKSK